MDLKSLLSAEIYGIFLRIKDLTGFSRDQILALALFYLYPDLFPSSNSDLYLPLFLDADDWFRLGKLAHEHNQSRMQLVSRILDVPSLKEISPSFPVPRLWEEQLPSRSEFDNYCKEDVVSVFLEKLIIKMHLSLQPEAIIMRAFQGNSESIFVLQLPLGHEDAVKLSSTLDTNSFYHRRVDLNVRRIIYSMFHEGESVDLLE